MENNINILFTGPGRRVSQIRLFRKAMDSLGLQGKILITDSANASAAGFAADQRFVVPRTDHPDYIPNLLKICKDHNINLLISLIDMDLNLLANHKQDFDKSGTRVLISSPEITAFAFDKRKTFEFFTSVGIDTPKVYTTNEIKTLTKENFPLIVKPVSGSASVGVHKVTDLEELHFFLQRDDSAIVQDYIAGPEYTIDVYVDFSGKTKCIVPRLRLAVRAGAINRGLTVRDSDIIQQSLALVEKLPNPMGVICLQCIQSSEGLKFIEINPRFGGGAPFSILVGADFPKWILQEHIGLPCDASFESWQDNMAMLRYDAEIIVSGDDIS